MEASFTEHQRVAIGLVLNATECEPFDYARRSLLAAALSAESVLSVVRALFCLAIGVRFLIIHLARPDVTALPRGVLLLSATALGCGFSLVVLRRIRRQDIPKNLLATCTAIEGLVCTLAIASNVLWPFPDYQGVLLLPESITFVACVFIAGLRTSFRIALLASLASTLGLGCLTLLDLLLNAELVRYGYNVVSLHAVLLVASSALAVFGAGRTERLVNEAAWYSFRNTRAERGLKDLLHEHHDAMGVLSAALFSVERLKRAHGTASTTEIEQDLSMLRQLVGGIRERALAEVLSLCPLATTNLAEVLLAGRLTFERAAEPLRVTWRLEHVTPVFLAGGERSLQRIMINLLLNAKQGDGRRGAKRANVSVVAADQGVLLTVEDDGPGFIYREGASGKIEGSAAGLEFVNAIVTASGGGLRVSRERPQARVGVWLPTASSDIPREHGLH